MGQALRHAGLQLLAGLLAWFLVAPLAAPMGWAGLQGLAAFVLAAAWHAPGWVRLLHLLFMPVVVAALSLGLPPWLYLLALVLTFALSRNALLEQVPFYRSSEEAAHRLAALLPEGARLLEAGSADARLALLLHGLRPDVTVEACENAWAARLLAQWRWWRAGSPAGVRLSSQNFWAMSWQPYNAVYVFLSPAPMARVWQKFCSEAGPGSLLVSNSFEVPAVEPDARIALSGPLQKELLIWHRPHGAR